MSIMEDKNIKIKIKFKDPDSQEDKEVAITNPEEAASIAENLVQQELKPCSKCGAVYISKLYLDHIGTCPSKDLEPLSESILQGAKDAAVALFRMGELSYSDSDPDGVYIFPEFYRGPE